MIIRILCILLSLCLLCSCGTSPSAVQPLPEVSEPEESPLPSVYILPEGGLTLEETVYVYFDQQYRSYAACQDIDLRAILDTHMPSIRNGIQWSAMLNQRRRLLKEMDLCYVETEMFPYTIRFLSEEELNDDRLRYWNAEELTAHGEVMLHFVVEGEKGYAYPPIMAVNAQHTMRFYQENGVWKLMFHYFPGAVRKFMREDSFRSYSDEEMRQKLQEEFAPVDVTKVSAAAPAPENAVVYRAEDAAAYAKQYSEYYNDDFYLIDDWMGDCANFTSQCIWSGFPQNAMDAQWYAGDGGGSPAWENVDYFWTYAFSGNSLVGQEIGGIDDARTGDLIQTSASGISVTDRTDDENHFNHSLMIVDSEKWILAQHSPGNFLYYSDLVNVKTRIFRPRYLHSYTGV